MEKNAMKMLFSSCKLQAPVVQKVDSTIHQINHCPVDKY